MVKITKHYHDLVPNYLFAEVANNVKIFKQAHPEADVISLGIGDVTLPLAPAVIEKLHEAADEMSKIETFMGYGPYEGYEFLRESIKGHYKKYGVDIALDEIFVSDGAKSDIGNILDLFGQGNIVLVPDPVYPAYVDANVMLGNEIKYVNANSENVFLPAPPDFIADIIYICSPNNPTGACYNREQLAEWVNYANANGSIILFDAAYECFIGDDTLPHSIYEIDGAKDCAIEICSFSKTAGFTGVRCGYTVIPKCLVRDNENLNAMWIRRAATKYNGTSYIIQKATSAVFTERGEKEINQAISYYKENAAVMAKTLDGLGVEYYGGKHSPYIWFKCPDGIGSWDMFHKLLDVAVVCTPGAGFGKNGEGFCRLSAFGNREKTEIAVERLADVIRALAR